MFDSEIHAEIRAEQEKREAEIESRLTCFFYLLLRDKLPSADLIEPLKEVEKLGARSNVPGFREEIRGIYTSKGIEAHARELSRRIMGRNEPVVEHEWVTLMLGPGVATTVEWCSKCGTQRVKSDIDPWEYFVPGKELRRVNGRSVGEEVSPDCGGAR